MKKFGITTAAPTKARLKAPYQGMFAGGRNALFGLGTAIVFSTPALAQTVSGGADPSTMVNNVCTFILGPFGQSLAVLGIVAIGALWMFGRASLGVIASIIGGIVIM